MNRLRFFLLIWLGVLLLTLFLKPAADVVELNRAWRAYGWPKNWLEISTDPSFRFFIDVEASLPSAFIALASAVLFTGGAIGVGLWLRGQRQRTHECSTE